MSGVNMGNVIKGYKNGKRNREKGNKNDKQ